MQDAFVVLQPKRYFGREKERQVFLFESNIVFTKKEELPTKKIRYLCKYHYLVSFFIQNNTNFFQLSDIHIVEHIEGDPTKFGLRKGSNPQGDQNTTILKASSEESRKLWVMKIREMILEMPMKAQLSDGDSNGSMMSYYNGSIESVKKLSVNDNSRLSVDEVNTVKQTSGNDPLVELRRPKRDATPNGITLSNDDFLLPLDENHYENLVKYSNLIY